MLIVAMALSAIAAFYSVAGLMAIFAAAIIPIAIMGTILETAKVTVTLWLHEYWQDAKWLMKGYLTLAVVMLMMITSMGIFGFLSKAHSDQNLVSGDVQAKISIYDEKIKIERDNIDAAKRALTQMDAQVDQMLGRTDNDRGAERAVQIRKNQAKERANLVTEIGRAQKEITRLNTESAPIRAEIRKVEAEVGPIKYIAALLYDDKPDESMLERAVRWVIICIVIVFDPLAIMMLLAATESMGWIKRDRIEHKPSQETVVEAAPPPPPPPPPQEDDIRLDDLAAMSIRPPEEIPGITIRPWTDEELDALNKATLDEIEKAEEQAQVNHPLEEPPVSDEDTEKAAMREWKASHPESTIKEQRRLFEIGAIPKMPWQTKLQADNEVAKDNVSGFGIDFPTNPIKGDQFLRVDTLPTRLYKYNGNKWIEVDKNLSDQYAYDEAYIDHLIEKIGNGEYDTDLLSEIERQQIAHRLQQPPMAG